MSKLENLLNEMKGYVDVSSEIIQESSSNISFKKRIDHATSSFFNDVALLIKKYQLEKPYVFRVDTRSLIYDTKKDRNSGHFEFQAVLNEISNNVGYASVKVYISGYKQDEVSIVYRPEDLYPKNVFDIFKKYYDEYFNL